MKTLYDRILADEMIDVVRSCEDIGGLPVGCDAMSLAKSRINTMDKLELLRRISDEISIMLQGANPYHMQGPADGS